MSLASPVFLVFIALTVIAFHLNANVSYRKAVLTAANVVFICSYVDGLSQLMPLVGFLTLSYAAIHLIRRQSAGSTLAICIIATLATYIVLKRFSFIEPIAHLPFSYLIIGLSYVLFRVLHMMIDARTGSLPGSIGPMAFFRYTCNFLCFVSGPIQRYQDFAAADGIETIPLDADRVYQAFARIVAGYAKFVVIAASADYLFNNVSVQLFAASDPGVIKLAVLYASCATAYTIYLYFNFSGYMDIVIGIGMLLGQTLPENFNRPFSARSFLEFWQRWHMTLSEWFKLYVFNPLLMALMTRLPNPAISAYLGIVAFFVTFLIMGVWHGTTFVFVIYGLLMGAGASINKLWQVSCTQRLGKKRYRAVTQQFGYIYLARGLTFAYFTLALTCLWAPQLPQFIALIEHLGLSAVLGALVGLTLAFALAAACLDAVLSLARNRFHVAASVASWMFVRNLSLAGKILAILAIASLFNKSPDFVYKAF